jgi:hypothetical protein
MTVSVRVGKNINLDGKTYSEARTVTAEGSSNRRPSRAAAKTGALTTRTDNDTGEITGQAGHGVTTGAKLDVYWDGGCRRNMLVGTVAGTAIPVDGGAGDNLPAEDVAVTFMVPVAMELRFDGDDLKALAVSCTVPAIVVLTGDDDVEDYAIMMPNDGMAVSWDSESGVTNPVAGDVITKAYITHGSSAGTKEVAVGIATD